MQKRGRFLIFMQMKDRHTNTEIIENKNTVPLSSISCERQENHHAISFLPSYVKNQNARYM